MLFLSFLIQQLKPHIVFTSQKQLPDTCPLRLDFIDSQQALTADRTWIGCSEQAMNILENIHIEAGSVIFISDYKSDNRLPQHNPETAIICVCCSLSSLYNIINNALCMIRMWTDQYLTAADQSLYATVNLTSGLSSSPALLLNPNYQIILSSRLDDSTFLSEQLSLSGILSERIVAALFSKETADHLPVEYSVPGSSISLYGQRIYHEGKLISVLVLEDGSGRTDIDFRGLCVCAGQALYRHIIPANSLRLGTYTKKFKEFWLDIMAQQLTQTFEVQQELACLPYPTEAFVRVIVVTFQNKSSGGTPYSFILAELREVFPDCNTTVYENEIIILKTYSERCFRLNLDTQRLTAILERHNAFAGISNGSRDYGILRSLYLLAKNTILLARELRQDPKERIFFYEDYWVYSAIDMCAHRFYELHHHDDIVYLIHPAIIHLTRYDKQHNTNLRETLYYYLLNDRNLIKTAAVTFAHRNTVINKVNKINKLICLDLEDGVLRQRLIFSCQIIQYYEKYMKKSLKI